MNTCKICNKSPTVIFAVHKSSVSAFCCAECAALVGVPPDAVAVLGGMSGADVERLMGEE